MDAWEGRDFVVVVDAALSGAAVGAVHRFDAGETRIPEGFFHYSSHQFAVAEAIEMARVLGRLPRRLVVFGIEGGDFSYSRELSPEVAAAVETVAAAVAALAHAQDG